VKSEGESKYADFSLENDDVPGEIV